MQKPFLIFDLHGVLLGRHEPAQHLCAGKVLDRLRIAGYPLRFLTNASSQPRQQVMTQLACVGIDADIEEIYTAGMTVAHYLHANSQERRLYLIGSEVLRDEINQACGALVEWVAPEQADTIVISRTPMLTDDILQRLVAAPAPQLIATCRDTHFPDGGLLNDGPGHTVSRVEQRLHKQALVLGKPNPYVLNRVMGLSARECAASVVIGDSPHQDVALARAAGARAILVSAAGVPTSSGPVPDHTIDAIDQLLSLLCR